MDTQDSELQLAQDETRDGLRVFRIYRFHIEDDLAFINSWLSKRGLDHWPKSELPALGYMVYSNYIPVAAGFLRECEGNVAIFDSLVADPDCRFEIRDSCIDLLVKHMLRAAREKGFKKILGYSVNKRTLERSLNHGFATQPHTVISISL